MTGHVQKLIKKPENVNAKSGTSTISRKLHRNRIAALPIRAIRLRPRPSTKKIREFLKALKSEILNVTMTVYILSLIHILSA